MISNPGFDNEKIAKLIEKNYVLNVEKLAFLPAGLDGVLYVFESEGYKYIAKIVGFRRSTENKGLSQRIEAVASLAKQCDFVVGPLINKDYSHSISFDTYTLSLYPFIDAQLMADHDTSFNDLHAIAQITAKLHLSAVEGLVEDPLSMTEIDLLKRQIGSLEQYDSSDQIIKRMIEVVRPWVDIIYREIDEVYYFQKSMKQSGSALVVTHGDLSPGNILFGNQIKIIDWEGIHLSYPEQDVNFFTESNSFRHFLPRYLEVTGFKDLSMNSFSFFKYKWELEGMAERISMIADIEKPIDDRHNDLTGLEDELDGHKYLKRGLEVIQEVLKENKALAN